MIYLVSFELRKIWKSRFFLVSLLFLMLTNLFLLWIETKPSYGAFNSSAYNELNKDIAHMDMQEMNVFLHDSLKRAEALKHVENVLVSEAWTGSKNEVLRSRYQSDIDEYYEIYKAGDFLKYCSRLDDECAFLQAIVNEFEVVSNYSEFISNIQKKAEQLSKISIFSSEYETLNISKTAEVFKKMQTVSIRFFPQRGIFVALNFELTDLIALVSMLLVSVVLIRYEKDSGLLRYIYSMPAGHVKTACSKVITLFISLLPILIFLYGTNLMYCHFCYGLGPLQRSIQSVALLRGSAWNLSVWQYLCVFFLAKWLASLVSGIWVMLGIFLCPSIYSGVLLVSAFFASNLIMFAYVPATSHFNIFKFANLIGILRVNKFLGEYHNLYWFGVPISILLVVIIAAIIYSVIFFLAFLIIYSNGWMLQAQGRNERNSFKQIRRRRFLMSFTSPLQVELYKLFIIGGALLIILLYSVYQVITVINTPSDVDIDEIFYQYYMTNLQGKITREKIEWLNEQGNKFAGVADKSSATKTSTYESSSLEREKDVYMAVVDNVQRVMQLQRCPIVYETGWLKLFDAKDVRDIKDALTVSILSCICFSSLFAMEHQSGMNKIICGTPLGRTYTVKCKLVAMDFACVILTVVSIMPQFLISLRDYGLACWWAPLYSISQYASMPEIPLAFLVVLMVIARYVAIRFIAGWVSMCGEVTKKTFGALFVAFVTLCLPIILSVGGLTDAKWLSIYPLFHIATLFQYGKDSIAVLFYLFLSIAAIYIFNEFLFSRFGTLRKSL